MMETLLKNIRYAARVLLQKPGFTAIAVVALALGIGANTAIFSVVNGVLLRPLPYRNPERLVHVHRMQPPIERGPISRPDFFEWRDKQEVFSDIGAYHSQILNLTGKEQAERLVGARVTGNFFSLFDPIGNRVKALDGKPHEIVGVVGDARQWGLDSEASAEVYFSFSRISLWGEPDRSRHFHGHRTDTSGSGAGSLFHPGASRDKS